MPLRLKSVLITLTIIASSLIAPLGVQNPAQAAGFRSTYGTDFWVSFDRQYIDPPSAAKIFVAAVAETAVEVTWADASVSNYSVAAGTVLTIDALPKWISNSSADGIATTGIHLTSNLAVSLYLLNNQSATTDAAIAYPTPFLSTRYRISAAPNELNGLDNTRFSVLATTDSTVITVSPSVNFGSRTSPYQISLNAGQAYTAESTANLIGTLVESNFPVQVSGSNQCANLGRQACDHLFEFMTPTDTWGKSFVVAGAPNTNALGDRYVVMSDQDSTDVWVNGTQTSLTNGGDYLLFTGSVDDAIGRGDVITSSKPVQVMQFIDGGQYGSPPTTGDPAMVVIPPTTQYLNDALFTTPATGFTQNSVTVIAKTSEVGVATLDGVVIPSSDFKELTGTTFSVARLFISLGTHRIASTSGIGVFSYGYNPADSYAYAAGSGLVNLITYPGGVEEVGFVAVEEITGDDNQAPPANNPPAVSGDESSQTPPAIRIRFTDVSPRLVTQEDEITFTGRHLDKVHSASIDGLPVSFLLQSSRSIVVVLPFELTSGVKTVRFESGEGLIFFQAAFTVVETSKLSLTHRIYQTPNLRQEQLSDISFTVSLLPEWVRGFRCVINSRNSALSDELRKFCRELGDINSALVRSSDVQLSSARKGSFLRLEFFR